ncbi:Rapamycin-insensitive companion of mTOR, N-term-domain-containing protein [Sphaerosporella brunnea]|uniref:Rapamycin-insensitive companion of mTOR, N-term-domain-containing protein n=1 Tax=Sphaerosporella brunnea TaxID=1250544 RepID=A0A5J5EEJ0_9PEZI|nr:Rapamycin-insensitive companion of mTOR, N-term-domain-containing protein [Sphaerosporella brunnea]
MPNASTTSPKAFPASARVRGGSGSSGHLVAPRNNGTGASLAPTTPTSAAGPGMAGLSNPNGPGGFSSSLRSTNTSFTNTLVGDTVNTVMSSEALVEELTDQLNKAIKYKVGAENLLQVLDSKKVKEAKRARNEAEKEYNERNREITQLQNQIAAITKPRETAPLPRVIETLLDPPVQLSRHNGAAPDMGGTESPTLSLTDLLRDLEEKGNRNEFYIDRANQLVALLKRHPNLKYELSWDTFGQRLHCMLLHENKEVIAAGYRVTRAALTDLQSLKTIRKLHVDHLAILSMVSRSTVEREQALKFVRAFIEIPGGVTEISRGVVRAIVACAETLDDRLRGIAIETLAEIMVLNPSLVVSAGGVRVLTLVLAEGPWEIAEAVSIAFLYLLDMPATRKYVRPGHDLEIVFSAFTGETATGPKNHADEEKLRSAARVISGLLKSWPGFLCLSMFGLRALRSLVYALRIPSSGVRDVILELFFDVFRIKPPSWSTTFLAGRRLTTYGRVTNLKMTEESSKPAKSDDRSQGNLVEHYTSLLLAVFFDAGLLENLIFVVEDNNDPTIVRKTTLLLGEVLKLASRLLPNNYSARKQLLPNLFSSAARFGIDERFSASSAVYQIDSLNRTLHRSLSASTPHRLALEEEKRGQRQVELKMKLNMTIDDRHFSNLIVDTGVLNTKSYIKWNWDALNEMIQGPLLNPKRLEEAIKVTKFMKRLLSFYRPFKYRFSEIKNTKPNQRYVRTGCALFHTLLQTSQGVQFLAEHKILRQIAECLAQLDKMSGIVSPEPLFSQQRLNDTLSRGYFNMLGTLSSDPKGLAMMERWRMFNMFYHISDLQDRPDLLELFVSTMDFSLEGHPRIILSKALTTGPKSVRLYATNHLRSLTSPEDPDKVASPRANETAEWAIRLLITQLYDPDVEVCETAVRILEEACNTTHSLEYVVKCRPALDHLGEIGAPLLLRFLSTSVGYHYLNELDYIHREMDDWFHGRNDSYVTAVEASLARAFAEDEPQGKKSVNSTNQDMLGMVPPHFYRELARTSEGCKLLREKGHFEEFALFIQQHGREHEDPEIVMKVKGCLWAVGNIGSMPFGAPFLDEADIVSPIIEIAESSQVLTLKGTAFFVLGLISKTMQGLEILLEHGWDAATSIMGETLGFCVPFDLKRILSVEPWDHTRDETSLTNRPTGLSRILGEDPIDSEIIGAVANLSNHIKESQATKDLVKLKAAHASHFASPDLYRRIMGLLESYRYRLQMRRFIIEMFDKLVIEHLVREGAPEPAESPQSPEEPRV